VKDSKAENNRAIVLEAFEPGVILAEGDFVIIHGRFSGFGLPVNWIAADTIRMKDGILLEHWDVIQDEATEEQSKSGNPMFGDSFPQNALSGKSTFYREAQTFNGENPI
jgi:predicted SnoaL-like aldol condensation-catalyzing enzyme